jgi:hypothetical protein
VYVFVRDQMQRSDGYLETCGAKEYQRDWRFVRTVGVLVWRLVKDLGGNVLFTELLVVFRPAPSRLQRLDVLREVVFAIEVCREAGSCCH